MFQKTRTYEPNNMPILLFRKYRTGEAVMVRIDMVTNAHQSTYFENGFSGNPTNEKCTWLNLVNGVTYQIDDSVETAYQKIEAARLRFNKEQSELMSEVTRRYTELQFLEFTQAAKDFCDMENFAALDESRRVEIYQRYLGEDPSKWDALTAQRKIRETMLKERRTLPAAHR